MTAALHPAKPAFARLLWAATMLLALLTVTAGAPRRYMQLSAVSPEADGALGQLLPAEAERMAQSGLTVEAYAAYFTTIEVLSALGAFAVASLIFWGSPNIWMALVVSHLLIAIGAVLPVGAVLERAHPLWAALILGWRIAFAAGLVPLFLLFPDGRFVPRWTRWLAPVWAGYTLLWPLAPALRPPFSFGGGLTAAEAPVTLVLLGALLGGAAAQVWRYRRVSTPLERLRTRWVVFGFVLLVTFALLGIATLTYLAVAPAGPGYALLRLAGPSLILIGLNALIVSMAVSALRYRLWEIDVIIRRTLIYSALTAMLAAAYLGSVVVLQAGFGLLTGERRNELVTVLSTLVIAALFVPLRARVQRTIDRRFYRQKYNAARTLAAFGAQARDVVELEQLQGQLVRVVDETMQPAHVSLWVRPPKIGVK